MTLLHHIYDDYKLNNVVQLLRENELDWLSQELVAYLLDPHRDHVESSRADALEFLDASLKSAISQAERSSKLFDRVFDNQKPTGLIVYPYTEGDGVLNMGRSINSETLQETFQLHADLVSILRKYLLDEDLTSA